MPSSSQPADHDPGLIGAADTFAADFARYFRKHHPRRSLTLMMLVSPATQVHDPDLARLLTVRVVPEEVIPAREALERRGFKVVAMIRSNFNPNEPMSASSFKRAIT